ncbi:MAG: glycosyltransferase [Candidatus Methanoplasma sp.]|nr:glycosyltransferase [Candidatus Methanoplasma sp.]
MNQTGLGKYADSVGKCLENEGIEFNSIPFVISLSGGWFNLFADGFIRPLISVLRSNSKDRTFHATDELCGVFFPLIRGRKILTVHHVVKKGEYRGALYYAMWNIITAMAIKSSDKVIAISGPTKKEIIEKFGVDPGKVVCVMNPIDDEYRILENTKKEKMIGCLGMLIPRKNTSSAIAAFKLLSDRDGMSDYCLEICGKGPEKEKLHKLAADLEIDSRVRFVSDLSNDDVVRFYNRSALIFNTSLHEGIGLVTMEAQRCGTPVLHLARAKIPEEITRFSVPCADEADMAGKAYELLADPKAYAELAGASKEYADAFGKNYCQRYIDLIMDLK